MRILRYTNLFCSIKIFSAIAKMLFPYATLQRFIIIRPYVKYFMIVKFIIKRIKIRLLYHVNLIINQLSIIILDLELYILKIKKKGLKMILLGRN